MIYESGFPSGEKGYAVAYRAAFDFAYAASRAASKKTGQTIRIGMPEVEFNVAWYANDPAAKLVPIDAPPGQRIGVAQRAFVMPESIDAHNVEVAQLFLGVSATSSDSK